MQPLSIIEDFDVVEQGGFCLFPGFEAVAMDAFHAKECQLRGVFGNELDTLETV